MIRRLILAAAMAIGIGSPARADPISAALATALGGGAFATAAASFITNMVVGFALSMLSKALAPKPKTPGIKTDYTTSGETMAQSFILGRYATGGNFVAPPMSHGDDNRILTYVVDLGDMPIEGLAKVYVDGEEVPFDGPAHADYGPEATGRLAGDAWMIQYDGNQIAADPMLLDKYGSYPDRPWQSDMILRSVPYVILTFEYNRELYSGLPRVRFEADGIPLYDPRLDTTVGGAGAHRWGTKATWAWSDNPAVMAYNILRGITLPDGSVWGMRAAADDLPLSVWFAAMNACDEEVALDAGGTEKRYRAGIEVTVEEEPLAVIEELMRSCGGDVVEFGGHWHISVGAPASATLAITDDDLIVSSPRDYEPFPGLAETYNAVHAVYPSPANGWDPTDAVPIYNAAWEAEDGGRRLVADLQLDAVIHDTQVRRVMRELAQDNRRFGVHVLTLPPDALGMVPLSTLSWTSAHNGYTAKLFEVVRKVIDPATLVSTVLLRERDPADYDDDAADDAVVPTPPSRTITAPTIDGLDGWAVAAVAITDAAGANRRPAIRMSWNPEIIASAISWRIRVQATGVQVAEGTISDLTTGRLTWSAEILADTTYEVQGRAVSRKGTEWTVWSTVTTDDLRLGQVDLADSVVETIFPATPSTPTGLSVTSSLASDGRVTLVADWSDNPGAVTHYEVGVTESGGNEIVLTAGASRFEASNVRPNTPFSVRVRAVNTMGDKSDWTAAQAHTTAKDNTPPSAPVLGTVAAGFDALWLSWTLAEPVDMSHYEIVERATNSAPGVSTTPNFFTTSKTFARTGLGAGTKRYYWVRAVDTSGNKSGWSSVQSATTAGVPGVTSEDIAGLVDQTSFASGLTGVEIVGTLPTTGNFEGRTVLLTTDGKLYRYRAVGGWTNEVDGADLKADSVTTGAVAAGAIKTAQLAAGAATIEKLSIGDFTNLLENPSFELVDENGDLLGWDLQGSASDWLRPVGSTHARSGTGSLQHSTSTLHSQAAAGTNIVVAAEGDEFFLSGWILGDAVFSHAGVRMVCFDAAGVSLGGLNVTTTTQPGWGTSNWVRVSGIVAALPGTATVRFDLAVFDQSSGTIRWDDVYWSRANAGELTVDGGIEARHVGTNEIIANTANVKDGILTNAKIANLSAAKLIAGTALTNSLTVNGATLGTLGSWATDPAARINAASTSILPGKIIISGGTSLESWRRAGDTTKIDGGAISSASVTTDKLTVGNGKNLYNDAQFATGIKLLRKSGSDGTSPGGGVNSQSNLAVRTAGSQWAGATYPTVRLEQNGTSTDGYCDILPRAEAGSTDSRQIPVKPGQWYELSVYTSTHRCTGRLFMQFFQSDGTTIPNAPWSDFGQDSSSSGNPDEWPRRWMKTQAPAGAAFVRPIFRKYGTLSGANSYLFIHKPMVAETHAEATEPAPWSPGGQTIIDGGMLKTGAMKSTNLVPGSVGWSIDVAGNAEFNNLIVRNSLVQGAVTDGSVERAAAAAQRGNNYVVCEVYSGPISFDEFWHLSVMGETRLFREDHYFNSDTGTAGKISYITRLQLRILTKNAGVWDAGWTPLWSSSAGNGDQSYFVQNQMTVHYAGDHEDMRVQLLLTIDVSGTDNGGQPTGTDTYTNIRNAGLVVQSMSQR